MHSRVLYLHENIENYADFINAKECAPPDYEVAECLGFNDYAVDRTSAELVLDVQWFKDEYTFFQIQKDEIGYFFEITKDSLNALQIEIYDYIKKNLENFLRYKFDNTSLLNDIMFLIDDRYGFHLLVDPNDAPITVRDFILNYYINCKHTIRYYIVHSYDYHY